MYQKLVQINAGGIYDEKKLLSVFLASRIDSIFFRAKFTDSG